VLISSVLVGILFSVNHPIRIGLILISYSVAIGLCVTALRTSWFFYLLVLVFLGGVIVLIIYMRTLSSNEKFWDLSLSPNLNMFYIILGGSSSLSISIYMVRSKSDVFFCGRAVLYGQTQLRGLIFLIVYLLLVLLCVVKLVKFEFGPLVKRL